MSVELGDFIGTVGSPDTVLDLILSLDTNAYAAGDLLADTQEIANAVRKIGGTAILQSLVVNDEDDQGVGMKLIFLDASTSLGSENAALNMSDAMARAILGIVSVGSGEYVDAGGARVATKTGIGMLLKAATGTRSLYVAAVTDGAPTHSAAGVRLKIGLLRN